MMEHVALMRWCATFQPTSKSGLWGFRRYSAEGMGCSYRASISCIARLSSSRISSPPAGGRSSPYVEWLEMLN